MIRFSPFYFVLALVLFVTEVAIALYIHDKLVRPYMGDVLVVLLIYCFVRSFFAFSVTTTVAAVLLFSFVIETLQYLNLVKVLGLENSRLATTVLGSSFSWEDLVAYTVGATIILLAEKVLPAQKNKP